jgi:hypothetical protein
VKTGRLLKFKRPGGEIHAYLYHDGEVVRASLYLLAPGYERSPVHEVTGADSDEVEAEVRDWVDCYFPGP